MAEQAALTATVRARLDDFERDMRKAEDIIANAIDKMERELGVRLDVGKRIEESLNQAQPRLRSATVAIGNLISQAITASLRAARRALDDFIDKFQDVTNAARFTEQSVEAVATATEAIGSRDVPKAMQQIATLLDRARRGEENALTKLLEENNQTIASIKNAGDAWDRVARLIANTAREVSAVDIAKSLGISEDVATRLFAIGKGYDEMLAKSRAAGQRMEEINQSAQAFSQALDKVIDALKKMGQEMLQWAAGPAAKFLEVIAKSLEGLAALAGLGSAISFRVFGIDLPGQQQLENAATRVRELADATRELSGEMTANQRVQSAFKVFEAGAAAGGGPAREGPFTRLPSLAKERAEGRDPFERELDRIRKSIALHEAEARTIGDTAEARERARTVATLEEAAIRANTAAGLENTAVTAQQREQIEQMANAMEQVIRKQTALQFVASEMRNLAGLMSNAIEEMVFQGKKLDEVLRNIAQRLASRALQQALERLLVTAGTGLFGTSGIGGVLGGTFNPVGGFGRQAGGHVTGGRSYLVGEQGPELFVPTQSGQVIPNHALGGMGGVTINQTYDARGADVAAIRRLELIIAEDRRALPGRVMASITDAKRRSAGR